MATEVGVGYVSIVPSAKGFGKKLGNEIGPDMPKVGADAGGKISDGLNKSTKGTGTRWGRLVGDDAANGLSDSMRRSKAKVGAAAGVMMAGIGVAAAAVGVGVFKASKAAVTAASDLGESINAVNVTFGDAADGIKKLGEKAATSLGLSATEFNGLSVQFSNFATTIAGPGGDVVKVMDDLTTRAADFASVMNLDVAEAARLFQSGLAGESEPLRQYGIDLSDAAIKAHALAAGIWDGTGEMTEQEKVLARYSSVMEQTNKTAGDFANTSSGMANQQRILTAEWDNLKAAAGEALIPIIERYMPLLVQGVTWATGMIQQNMPQIQGAMTGFADKVIEVYPQVRDWLLQAAAAVRDNWPQIKETADGIRDAVERVWEWTGVLWSAWQGLPQPVKETLAMLAIAQKTGVLSVAFKVTDIVAELVKKIAGMNIQAAIVNVNGSASGATNMWSKGGLTASFAGGALIAAGAAYAYGVNSATKDGRPTTYVAPSNIPMVPQFKDPNNPQATQGPFTDFWRKVFGKATGGPIYGTGSRDSVPIMAQPGEYVLSRRMVDQFGGVPRLESVRQGIGGAGGITIGTLNVNNPVAERTSESLPRTVRKLAYAGGLA